MHSERSKARAVRDAHTHKAMLAHLVSSSGTAFLNSTSERITVAPPQSKSTALQQSESVNRSDVMVAGERCFARRAHGCGLVQ